MESTGPSWWQRVTSTVGTPVAILATNEMRRHNVRVRKHNGFSRRVLTDQGLQDGLYNLDEYVPLQIKTNEVSPEDVMARVNKHFCTMSKKDQRQYDHWNFQKHGTELCYDQNWSQRMQNDGTIVVKLKEVSPSNSNSKPPFASISQDSFFCNVPLSEFSQISEIPILEPNIPRPVYTVACASPSPSFYYKVPSTAKSFDSPWENIAGFLFFTVLIYGGLAIKNKIQTGSFFTKKLSEIEILIAYKNQILSLKQARILLTHNHKMSFELAMELLTDSPEINE